MKQALRLIIGTLICAIALRLLWLTKQADPEIIYIPATGQVEVVETIDTGSQSTGAVILEDQQVEEVCTPIGVNVTAKFTQWFIDNYEYEHSDNFLFALKINGFYIGSRNYEGGIDFIDGHQGPVSAKQLIEGHTRFVPFNVGVLVAQPNGIYGYRTVIFTGVDTYELSTVKEGVQTSELTLENEFKCF